MTDKVYLGPDLSEFNGNVNFDIIKKNFDFVILRCGYGGDYTNQDDTEFKRNASECERLGIPYGVYLYSYAKNVEAAKNEAAHTLRLIKGRKLLYGVWYDIEDASLPKDSTVLADICTAYLDAIKEAGFYAGIYANLFWFENYLSSPRLSNYDKWVAQWNSTLDYTGNAGIWQFTSSYTIEGLSGRFDMNRAFRNYPEIIESETPDPKPPVVDAKKVRVTASSGLNVRSGPGTSYEVLKAVPYQTELTVTEKSNGWGKLSTGGWIFLEYTEPADQVQQAKKYTVTAPSGLNIRSGPGTSYSVLKAVPNGTVLTITSQKDGWGRLQEDGWVSMEYVVPSSQEKKYTVNASSGLNIRSGPGTSYSVLKAAPNGTVLTVVSQKDGWGALKDGGYASMEFLTPQ